RRESRTLFAGYGPSQGLAVLHGGRLPIPSTRHHGRIFGGEGQNSGATHATSLRVPAGAPTPQCRSSLKPPWAPQTGRSPSWTSPPRPPLESTRRSQTQLVGLRDQRALDEADQIRPRSSPDGFRLDTP